MGFSPPAKVVIISLFIHMQAVVLDGNRLGCGHPSRKPPASPGPSSPCPPVSLPSASSLLLVASTSVGLRVLGAAGTITLYQGRRSWPLMSP